MYKTTSSLDWNCLPSDRETDRRTASQKQTFARKAYIQKDGGTDGRRWRSDRHTDRHKQIYKQTCRQKFRQMSTLTDVPPDIRKETSEPKHQTQRQFVVGDKTSVYNVYLR
ncbi:hypothetical protein DPMN_118362 [Dreissena polymorpha]|uniref:Uncharacterized protein n=1 Tax=Dreissena polymorpha TaxID=45954 RepID=A0A9D4GK18_DREPO|nr:hypothetical protein DPMN_118362 [Dreissena polymorpha]